MGEGTTRVIETNGDAAGRVSELDGEITDVRQRLDWLVTELDRRRHNVTNLKHLLRRYWVSLAIGGVAFAAALATPVALARRRRARRRRIFGVSPEILKQRAQNLTQALAQATRAPERPEPRTALPVGQSTFVGMLLMVVQVIATSLMREALERRRR